MNMEIEKKEYVAPAMTIVDMKMEAPLLGGSECLIGCAASEDPDDPWDLE
ncbi:MAG: hypothetical protein MJZ25_03230 [Fibrobacter sp.]|nr:hypothetical protein [Fibrobacter sp.]